MVIRLLDTGKVGSVRSQSIYHGLGYAQNFDTPSTIVFTEPNEPYMCTGYFQDVTHELNLEYCRARNLPIIRRETGGGTVFIDQNQMFVQWVFQDNILPKRIDQRFQLFLKPLVETLRHFGINAYYFPVNDVHVGGKKIVGTGAATIGSADIVTGNFLFDFNYQVMVEALKVPDPYFKASVTRDIGKYMTTFREELGKIPPKEEVKQVYINKCEETLGASIRTGELSLEEEKAIEKLDTKLADAGWVYEKHLIEPENRIIKIHAGVWIGKTGYTTDAGKVEVMVAMRDNMITELNFHIPDHTSMDFEIEALQNSLLNTELSYSSIEVALNQFFDQNQVTNTGLDIKDWIDSIMNVKAMQEKAGGDG